MKEYRTFTYDDEKFEGLPDFVRELNKGGMKHVITIVSLRYTHCKNWGVKFNTMSVKFNTFEVSIYVHTIGC